MIGEVMGAVGLDGAVRVRPLTDFPDRLLDLGQVRLARGYPGGGVRAEVRRVLHSERRGASFVMVFEGVGSREAAGALAGSRLEVPMGEAHQLPAGHYYRFQLVGLLVEDETGRRIGRVREIIETGANDVLVVTPDQPAGPRDETLVPALKETVQEIDLDAGRIIVKLLPIWGE